MSHLSRALIYLVLCLICQTGNGFDRLVIFGDSLSDTGNLTGLIDLPSPYYRNRISNGPVAVDVLASRFGLSGDPAGQFSGGSGYNFAVSGGNAAGSDPEDLGAQINAFRNRHPAGTGNNTLYVIMIGGNDLRNARNFSNSAVRAAIAESAVNAIDSAIGALDQLDTATIIVANAPDISRIPETLDQGGARIAQARSVTILFNTLLKNRLSNLESTTSSKLIGFDLFTTFNNILSQPLQSGFDITDRACFNTTLFVLNPGCNFERFVFFDSIHPTAKAHAIFGNALYSRIRAAMGASIAGALQLLLE